MMWGEYKLKSVKRPLQARGPGLALHVNSLLHFSALSKMIRTSCKGRYYIIANVCFLNCTSLPSLQRGPLSCKGSPILKFINYSLPFFNKFYHICLYLWATLIYFCPFQTYLNHMYTSATWILLFLSSMFLQFILLLL